MAKQKDKKPTPEGVQEAEAEFSKEQILRSQRFRNRHDILDALLARFPEEATFTVSAVEELIDSYMKGQVN